MTEVEDIIDDERLVSSSLSWGARKVGKVSDGKGEGKKPGRYLF